MALRRVTCEAKAQKPNVFLALRALAAGIDIFVAYEVIWTRRRRVFDELKTYKRQQSGILLVTIEPLFGQPTALMTEGCNQIRRVQKALHCCRQGDWIAGRHKNTVHPINDGFAATWGICCNDRAAESNGLRVGARHTLAI